MNSTAARTGAPADRHGVPTEDGPDGPLDLVVATVWWIVVILGVVAVLLTVMSLVFGWKPTVVRTGAMAPAVSRGAIVLLEPEPLDRVRVGQVVGAAGAGDRLTLHRVVSTQVIGPGQLRLVLKGDANSAADRPIVVDEVFTPIVTLPALFQPLIGLDGPRRQFLLGLLAGGSVAAYAGRRQYRQRRERLREKELQRRMEALGSRRAPAGPAPATLVPQPRVPDVPGGRDRDRDRERLRGIGVPAAWLDDLRGADRFDAVMTMLGRCPEIGEVTDLRVVAVIGAVHAVQRESHRIAVDLQDGPAPRPVLRLPVTPGGPRQVLVARPPSAGGADVVAVECPEGAEGTGAAAAAAVDADLVVAVVRARRPAGDLMSALKRIDRPIAVAFDGPARIPDVMPFLAAGVPVIRVDGIPLDRVALAALLCAYLRAGDDRPAVPVDRPISSPARAVTRQPFRARPGR